MKKNKLYIIIGLIVFILAIVSFKFFTSSSKKEANSTKPINSMLMLIEFEKIDGVLQWEKELDNRNLSALINIRADLLEENKEVFKRLSDKGYEVAGVYDKIPFWDVPFEEQYEYMKESQEKIKEITGKDLRVFGSQYFAYDENTLKAADELGIPYILGRGVNDVEATLYAPEEYNVKIISVTNVDVGEPMGRGSLCDYSLWARGADGEEFRRILDESINKNPENMIVVSHAYLGGTRLEWWTEYERILSSPKIDWNGFDAWIANQSVITLPNSEIPVNREVKYTTPNPAKPMEEYHPILGSENIESPDLPDDIMFCE